MWNDSRNDWASMKWKDLAYCMTNVTMSFWYEVRVILSRIFRSAFSHSTIWTLIKAFSHFRYPITVWTYYGLLKWCGHEASSMNSKKDPVHAGTMSSSHNKWPSSDVPMNPKGVLPSGICVHNETWRRAYGGLTWQFNIWRSRDNNGKTNIKFAVRIMLPDFTTIQVYSQPTRSMLKEDSEGN